MTKYDILIWDREWDGLNGSLLRKLEFIYLCSKINQSKTEFTYFADVSIIITIYNIQAFK